MAVPAGGGGAVVPRLRLRQAHRRKVKGRAGSRPAQLSGLLWPGALGGAVRLRQQQGEGTAHAKLALRAYPPAEMARDLAADRQAKAGSAVAAAGGPVSLLERAEDRVEILGGNADAGVAYHERDLAV